MTNSKKEILMQSNNLIKSKYDFSCVDNKIFYKMLYNAQKSGNPNSKLMETILSLSDFQTLIRRRNEATVENIKEKLETFQKMLVQFEYIDETDGGKVCFSSSVVTSYEYREVEQQFKIELHEKVYKQITDTLRLQSRGYSAINLAILFQFKGAYTQRLYTLFRLWSRKDKSIETKFTLDELRGYLDMQDTLYPAYKNFKQKVLNKALDEINKIGNMEVELSQEIKKGRSIHTLVFTIIDHEPRRYFENEDIIDITADEEQKGLLDEECLKEKIVEYSKFINQDNIPPMFTDDLHVKFLECLYSKGITLNELWEVEALYESCEVYTKNKGVYVVHNETNYKYFMAILENKITDHINKMFK